jgi:GGDEF domain-containing protein
MEFANLSIQTSDNHVAVVVEKLKNKLAEPIQLSDGSRIKLNAKIGIAEYPSNGSTHQDLMYVASCNIH